MKKFILLVFIVLMGIINSSSAAVGDYRTRASVTGNWHANNVWQKYYNPGSGNGWYDVATYPTYLDGAITILEGCSITITEDITLDEVNVKGTLTLNSSTTLTVNDGTGTDVSISNTSSSYAYFYVYGIIINQGTLSKLYGTIYYYNNSFYRHAQNGGTIEDASWSSNSTCEITGCTTSDPTNLDQSFGNFTWNCPGQTDVFNLPTIGIIYGNFTLNNTGSGGLYLSVSADVNLTIYGNYIQTGGNFYPSGGSATDIIYLYGNFSFSGGYISSPGTGSVTFNFSNSSPVGGAQTYSKTAGSYYQKVHFVVSNAAVLDMGSSIIDNTSSGNFTIYSGCGLKTTNASGITASGASGCIQLTGTRFYDPGSHYTFYANGGQSSGYQFATAVSGSVTIGSATNTTNFTVTSPTQIDGSFIIIKGTLANTNLSYGSSGILEYRGNASQTMGNNEWPSSTVPNLKINNSSGVAMNATKTISSTLILTSGALSIGSNTLNLNGAISTSSGSITGGLTSNIYIGGTISTNLPGVTSGLNNLSINRSAYTISLTGSITVNETMTMTAGAFALNGGTLTYGSSATLKYNGSGSAQTSSNAEFPVSGGPYNFYADNSSGVNLHSSRTLNGTLTLNTGAFSIGANTLTLNGSIVKNSGSLTGGSSSNISFGENAAIVSLPAVTNGLNNLSINRSGGVQITGSITVYGTLSLTNGNVTLSGGTLAYGSNGILQYDGATLQTSTDIEFPATNGPRQLNSNNGIGLVLHTSRSLNGALYLLRGNFDINGKTITLYDNILSTMGTMSGGATSSIDFEGTSASTSIPSAITLLNLTINRANGISLGGATSIEGTLTLSNGSLSIGSNTLTINGIISQTSGGLSGNSTSNIVYGVSGSATILPGVTVGKLTVNRTSGVSMTASVTVEGPMKISAGNLSIAGNTLNINGDVTGSSLVGSTTSSLNVGGTASNFTLPAITLSNFNLNRPNGITLGGNMDVYGTVTMINGSITPGGFQLIYHGLGSILMYAGMSSQTTTDVEFPSVNGPVGLTISNPSGVNMHDNRTVSGMLRLQNGNFSIGNNHTLTLNSSINTLMGGLQGGTTSNLILGGSLPTTLIPTVTLNNLTVNRTGNIVLNGNAIIYGTLALNAGTFKISSFTLTIYGDITQSSGIFNGNTSSVLSYEGSGLQANLPSVILGVLNVNRANGVAMSGSVNIYTNLSLNAGSLSIGANTLSLNGTIFSTGGSLAGGSSSNIYLAEGPAVTLPSINLNNLTIDKSLGVNLGGSVNVGGTLNMTNGTLTIGANNLIFSGNSPSKTNGKIDATDPSSLLTFYNSSAIIISNVMFTGSIYNAIISGIGGVTASTDITINGDLNLQASNPSSSKGSFDLWDGAMMKTLTLGPSATISGIGDVTGIVRRTSFASNVPYAFGNHFTTVTLDTGGVYPTQIQAKIALGSAPSWKSSSVYRIYQFTQSGGNDCNASIKMHYLDTELNGNNEPLISGWRALLSPLVIEEKGRIAYNTSDNWVALPPENIVSWPSNFDEVEFSLAKSDTLSFVWNGSQSLDWETADNWTPTGIPAPTSNNVTIPDESTTPNSPTLSTFAEIMNLTINAYGKLSIATIGQLTVNNELNNNATQGLIIKSDSSGTASLITKGDLTGDGTYKVELYLVQDTGVSNHLISPPIPSAMTNTFIGYYMYKYNEPTSWVNMLINQHLEVMRGYAVYKPNMTSDTKAYIGTVNSGTIGTENNLTRTDSTRGWNLLGNPYPSAIDWDAESGWTKTNVGNAIYTWDQAHRIYTSYVGGIDVNGGSNFIPSMQGFMVRVVQEQSFGTLQMTNDVRVHNTIPFWKNNIHNVIRLSASSGDFTDEAVIRFNPFSTAAFDVKWDAVKLMSEKAKAQLFTIASNEEFSINTLPEITEHLIVPLHLKIYEGGDYTITAKGLNSFDEDIYIYLEDLNLQKTTYLNANSVYSFSSKPEDEEARFKLHFSLTPLYTNVLNSIKTAVYSYDKTLYIQTKENAFGDFEVYDMLGKKLFASKLRNKSLHTFNFNQLAMGYYLIKVCIGNVVVMEKILMR